MKLTLLRSAAVLVMALGLASCGGGGDGDDSGDYEVRGTFTNDGTVLDSGVRYEGLKLSSGRETIEVPANATSYAFPTKFDYGDIYQVRIVQNPLHQNCSILTAGYDGVAGRDSAGRLTDINVQIKCELVRPTVFVKVPKPLAGLQITNGSNALGAFAGTEKAPEPTVLDPNPVLRVSFSVAYGESYGISILKQPTTGGPCSVENATGTMGDNNIDNVTVVCP